MEDPPVRARGEAHSSRFDQSEEIRRWLLQLGDKGKDRQDEDVVHADGEMKAEITPVPVTHTVTELHPRPVPGVISPAGADSEAQIAPPGGDLDIPPGVRRVLEGRTDVVAGATPRGE